MATNNSAAAARESRRRKILERGADRLALITGHPQTPPSQSYDYKPATLSSPPLNSNTPLPDLSDQTAAPPDGEDGGFSSVLPNNDSTIASSHSGSLSQPSLRMHRTSTDASRTEQSPPVSLIDQKASASTSGSVQALESRTRPNIFVTSSQISSAISASESLRLFCSVTIALFVVLSSLGFPILGSSMIKSMIGYRPLYLVLLTNLTLVVARLLLNNQRGFGRTVGGENNIPSTNQDWVEQAGKALEVGLVMQKAIDAILMDCSVYAIIVIAGFSFVK